MNEMYSMGLLLHSVGAVTILAMVFTNLFLLISSRDLKKYRRLNSIYLLPLTATIAGFIIFTGMIMMAAKHLDFTFLNIVMIVVAIAFIVLEVKRVKALKYLNASKERAFEAYKPFARRVLQIEFIMLLIISLIMWLV